MKIKIDITNPEHVKAAAAFFNELAGYTAVKGEIEPTKDSEEPAKKQRRTRAEIDASKKTEKAKKEEQSNEPGGNSKEVFESSDSDGEVTRDMIRELLAQTKDDKDKRLKAKEKCESLGAKNVSSLEEEHLSKFYTFLKDLIDG